MHRPLRPAAALLLSLLVIFALCGCQARETNLATQQADQAVDAAGQLLAQRVAPAVASLPPDVQAAVRSALDDAVLLLTSARESIRPALRLTAGSEPAPESPTSAQAALEHPREFVRRAAVQAGRAEIEVEGYLAWARVGSMALEWGKVAAGDLLSQLLLLTGGGAGAAALLAKGVQIYRKGRELQAATIDAVAFGNDMAKAETDKQAADVITAHKARQDRNGTRKTLQDAGAAAQPPTSAASAA